MKNLIFFLFLPFSIAAQTHEYIKITGDVFDSNTNNPLPYVSFSTETNLGTISNGDGRVILKYPKNLASTKLYISSIGYKTNIFILPEKDKDDIIFLLNPDTFSIEEVKVLPLEGDEIINKAINNISNNFHDTTIFMDIFYSKKKNNQMSLALRNNKLFFEDIPLNLIKQAVFTVKKESVNKQKSKELRRVNAFRYERENTGVDSIILAFKTVLTPSMDSIELIEFDSLSSVLSEKIIAQDLSKDDFFEFDKFDLLNKRNKHSVLSNKNIKKYIFQLNDIVKYNSRETYVINISPKSCEKKCYFYGTIYIDVETYAFVKESYYTQLSCRACNKSLYFFGAMKNPISKSINISYKKYELFWGLSSCIFNEINDVKLGKNIFGAAYLVAKLLGKIKLVSKDYFPKSIYNRFNHTNEFFVNDIYLTDDIGFNGNNMIKEKVVDEINIDDKDIWGKYNYLENNILQ